MRLIATAYRLQLELRKASVFKGRRRLPLCGKASNRYCNENRHSRSSREGRKLGVIQVYSGHSSTHKEHHHTKAPILLRTCLPYTPCDAGSQKPHIIGCQYFPHGPRDVSEKPPSYHKPHDRRLQCGRCLKLPSYCLSLAESQGISLSPWLCAHTGFCDHPPHVAHYFSYQHSRCDALHAVTF